MREFEQDFFPRYLSENKWKKLPAYLKVIASIMVNKIKRTFQHTSALPDEINTYIFLTIYVVISQWPKLTYTVWLFQRNLYMKVNDTFGGVALHTTDKFNIKKCNLPCNWVYQSLNVRYCNVLRWQENKKDYLHHLLFSLLLPFSLLPSN